MNDWLEEQYELGTIDEFALRFTNPDFDSAIIGVSHDGLLIYDYDLMVKQFMKDNNCEELDAIEFIDYNTLLAMHGSGMPIILMNKVEV